MRYEHIELDISTAACAELVRLMTPPDQYDPEISDELVNLRNNLAARLQRRDADPHCPLNEAKDWLDT